MVDFLIHRLIKNADDTNNADTRSEVGSLCGWIGIFCNVFLFIIKFLIGLVVQSVSIQADAINNLTDAGSNIIAILSFRFSNKPADKGHPFGHERTEMIASLFVALMIAYLGIEMIKDSFDKIFNPSVLDFRVTTIIILLISIGVKLWMYSYNKRLSKKYSSTMLEATALDSISDVLGTSALLVSVIVSYFIGFNLDGYMGVVVSLIILYNAYGLLKDVINSLLGKAPDSELMNNIDAEMKKDPYILGVHDLIIHDYGPNKMFASAHVEVNSAIDLLEIHEHIDRIERIVKENYQVDLVLHMDPVKVDDPETEKYRHQLEKAISQIDEKWQFHDFRIHVESKKTILIFDLMVPFEEKQSLEEIKTKLLKCFNDQNVELIITLDHPFV